MTNKMKLAWFSAIFSSGIIVAIFTFGADKAWELFRHRSIGPKYVDTSVRFENNKLFVFVRNNSDEPLDLMRVKVNIDDSKLLNSPVMGAYPDVSQLYSVSVDTGSASIEIVNNQFNINLNIVQAISPKESDHFGIRLDGLTGPVDL